ncbi:hypothetical protein MGG_17313 [Pyricularia oryzae 70-15]|uniref:Uncharacterized protein n=1 Tax=Pyricularia oryzae (strain 70-15 / ATCC MYA-4617 / FGSC 8958) TaxID=242507 RepID=G4NC55_PYRO7|nr:uncharacterized protein MGG_17313 [Pyricularia oryzae 70-15]EHA48204.1 hypothetical protein MGG_17313 [Pyricularia oryzae 70-15]
MYRPPHSLSCLSTAMDTPSFQQTHKTLLGTDFANDKPPNICSLHTPLIIYEVSTKTQHARKPSQEEKAEFRVRKPISPSLQPPGQVRSLSPVAGKLCPLHSAPPQAS